MHYQFISIDRLPVPAVPPGEWLNSNSSEVDIFASDAPVRQSHLSRRNVTRDPRFAHPRTCACNLCKRSLLARE